jgi:hypothetical protein
MKANTLDVDRGVLASLAKKATVWGLIPLIQISFFVSHSQTIPKQVRMKPNKSDVMYTACFLGKKDTCAEFDSLVRMYDWCRIFLLPLTVNSSLSSYEAQ